MKKFRIIETFTTAVITEIETGDDMNPDVGGDILIDAHINEVAEWGSTQYAREIADNAGNSEFEIEEIL